MGLWSSVKSAVSKGISAVKSYVSPKPKPRQTQAQTQTQKAGSVYTAAAKGKTSSAGRVYQKAAGMSERQISTASRRTGTSQAPSPQQYDAGGQPISVAPTPQFEVPRYDTWWQNMLKIPANQESISPVNYTSEKLAAQANQSVEEWNAEQAKQEIYGTAIGATVALTAFYGGIAVAKFWMAPAKVTPTAMQSLYATLGDPTRTVGMGVKAVGSYVTKNPKTYSLLTKIVVGAGIVYAAERVITDAYESITFGKFQIAEGMQSLGMAVWQADEAGMTDLADDLANELEILADKRNSPWAKIPWIAANFGTDENLAAAEMAAGAWKKILEHKREAALTGESEYLIFQREKDVIERARIDYYNEQAQIYADLERVARREARDEDAEFWRKEREKERELEELERQKIADFWLEYWKAKSKLQAESGRSTLGFGLF